MNSTCERAGQVMPGLFIGDITAAVEAARLKRWGVTHIVDLANTIHDHVQGSARNVHYLIPKEVRREQPSPPPRHHHLPRRHPGVASQRLRLNHP
jgi:hypothetical protein